MRFASPSSTYIGVIYQPGLPNITSEFANILGSTATAATGALYTDTVGGARFNSTSTDTGYGTKLLKMDASRSSELYGRYNTVMPYCMQVPAIIKY